MVRILLTEPKHGDRRLGRLFYALLDLVFRLSATGLLVLLELEVRSPLLGCLRLVARKGVSKVAANNLEVYCPVPWCFSSSITLGGTGVFVPLCLCCVVV